MEDTVERLGRRIGYILTSEKMFSIFKTHVRSLINSSTFPFESLEGITVSILRFSGTTRQRLDSSSQNRNTLSLLITIDMKDAYINLRVQTRYRYLMWFPDETRGDRPVKLMMNVFTASTKTPSSTTHLPYL